MPLTPDQLAALDTLFLGDDAPLAGATPEDIADGLRAKAGPVYTLVLTEGQLKAAGQGDKTMKKLQRDLTTATAEVERLTAERTNGAPPEFKKQLEDAQQEVRTLTTRLKEKDREVEQRDEQRELDRVMARVAESLGQQDDVGAVRPAWLKLIKADPDLRKRIRVPKGDTPLSIMQAGREIPISADDDTEDALIKALSSEVKARLKREDPDALKVTMDAGAGVEQDGGGGSGGGGEYDPVKEGKEMAKRAINQSERNKDLAFR
ncbi:MAG: hypothetical protein ABIQ32_01135 [Sphingomicrobium sp.]